MNSTGSDKLRGGLDRMAWRTMHDLLRDLGLNDYDWSDYDDSQVTVWDVQNDVEIRLPIEHSHNEIWIGV